LLHPTTTSISPTRFFVGFTVMRTCLAERGQKLHQPPDFRIAGAVAR
jgi:hypothetical protein